MIRRALCTLLAASMAYGACAEGVHSMVVSIGDLSSAWFQRGARHFTEAPRPVFKGADPRRDAQRLNWWKTPRLRADLVRTDVERAIRQAADRGDLFASIDPLSIALVVQESGGGGGGGGGEGEGSGPGGGSGGSGGEGGGAPGDGSGGSGGGGSPGAGGAGGETNTNTGNKLTVLPLARTPTTPPARF